jgi:hypothetical protein
MLRPLIKPEMIVGISFFVLLFSYKNIINEREAKTKGEAHEELRPLRFFPFAYAYILI